MTDLTDETVWRWNITGTAHSSSPGAQVRYVDESGEMVDDEGAGEVLARLLHSGPWDLIDHECEVSVTITPLPASVLPDGWNEG